MPSSIEALTEARDSWKQLYYAADDDCRHLEQLLAFADSFRIGTVDVDKSRDPERPGWWVRVYDGEADRFVGPLEDAIALAQSFAGVP